MAPGVFTSLWLAILFNLTIVAGYGDRNTYNPFPCPYRNWGIRNNNIEGWRGSYSQSWQTCADRCNSHPRCHFWTYNNNSRRCYLKNSRGQRTIRRYNGDLTGHWTCTGYGRPSDGYGRPSDGYGRPSDGYRRPSYGYGRPSDGYERPW